MIETLRPQTVTAYDASVLDTNSSEYLIRRICCPKTLRLLLRRETRGLIAKS